MPELPSRLQSALADRYRLEREIGAGGARLLVRFGPPGHDWHRYDFRSWRGRFYFTVGEQEGDLWSTTVEAER